MGSSTLHHNISLYLSGQSDILKEIGKTLTKQDYTEKSKSIDDFISILRTTLSDAARIYRSIDLLQEILLNYKDQAIAIEMQIHLGSKLRSLSRSSLCADTEKTVKLINKSAHETLQLIESLSTTNSSLNVKDEPKTLSSSSIKSNPIGEDAKVSEYYKSEITCMYCGSKDGKTVKIPCGCTSEPRCLHCTRMYIIDRIKFKLAWEKPDEIKCGACRYSSWDRIWIIGCLTLDQAKEYQRSQSEKFEIVECPQCKCPAYMGEDMFLGQCGICEICFCTNCKGPFHGLSECSTSSHTENDLTHENKSKGAEALDYEIDFYRDETNLEDITRKINDAFEINSHANDLEPFPWALSDPLPASSYQYFGKYSCLQPGSWLDDVTIEKSIRALFDSIKSSKHNLLDSFIMSSFFKLPTKEFNKMVNEKEIKGDETVFALLNTDVQSVGGHWMLGIIDQKNKMILIHDTSIVLSPTFYRKFFYFLLNVLHVAKNGLDFNPSEWKLCVIMDTIQQQNAYDCGAYLIANVYAYIHAQRLDAPPDSKSLREWIHLLLTTQGDSKNDSKVGINLIPEKYYIIHENHPPFLPKNLHYIYCSNESLKHILRNTRKSSFADGDEYAALYGTRV